MIKFTLICQDGHEFEAWFKSGAAYEAQSAQFQIACPHCGNHRVDKAVMSPAVTKRRESGASLRSQSPALSPDQRQALRQLREEVHAKAEYVGGKFAEEARKIHFNESDQRGIYGEASADEVKKLAEDGIPFFPMPRLPEDLN